MNGSPYFLWLLAGQRCRERLIEAEQQRMAWTVRQGQGRRDVVHVVLRTLGRWMIRAGNALLEESGEPAAEQPLMRRKRPA